jgi:hypothetical protein
MNRIARTTEFDFTSTAERKAKLLECIIEVWTDGERRALARAKLIEKSPDQFAFIPFYLREVAGPNIHWDEPAAGEPISTTTASVTFDEAHELLKSWAMNR